MIGPERLALFAEDRQLWFVGAAFVLAAAVEALRPERALRASRGLRWATNAGLHFLGLWLFAAIGPYALAVWLLTSIGGPHVSAFAPIAAWGGLWAALAASLLTLDLASYLVHRLEHAIFALWRIHSVHHADIDVDASTAVRHHPAEIIFSGMAVLLPALVLGMPLWAFPVYATAALVLQVAQHANVRLPARLESVAGLVLMTPGLHRTHHASTPEHYDSNFGTALSIWDRWFRTLAPPLPERDPPTFGVAPYFDRRYAMPHWALILPLALRNGQARAAAPDARRAAE